MTEINELIRACREWRRATEDFEDCNMSTPNIEEIHQRAIDCNIQLRSKIIAYNRVDPDYEGED